ncbi:hypothetical protein IF1G_00854 [Cordyceps javanica]|uniref:Uncharacterized protein n=1 Tax=Cordyceps javanica TaxID=43265 RepID=A0A545WDN9_9HYPO|nr:hypothetical protein IF1G_00854 [Cordyceps javanica]TQW12094.1 hypothetical protein IF2G_00825 [Cordyceps javanica]
MEEYGGILVAVRLKRASGLSGPFLGPSYSVPTGYLSGIGRSQVICSVGRCGILAAKTNAPLAHSIKGARLRRETYMFILASTLHPTMSWNGPFISSCWFCRTCER